MLIRIDPAILSLAACGLPRTGPLIRDGWPARLDEVFHQGLAGFLARAHDDDAVDLDRETLQRLAQRLETEAVHSVRLEGELIRLESTLATLRAVVLKGAILAHGAYPDPSLRPFTDLDLLVVGRDHRLAITAFERLGYQRSRPEPTPGFDARVGKALTLTHPGGVVIDLHRTLVAGVLGESIDVDELVATSRPIMLSGVAIQGPSWEAHLIESALHAVIGDGLARALSIRDVAQVTLHPDLEPERAVELSRRWRVAGPVADGLRAAVDGLGLELPDALAAMVHGQPTAGTPGPRAVRSAQNRLGDLRHGSLRRRITAGRALLTPSLAFLRWNYGAKSAPRLYARRWKDLYRRARVGRSGSPPTEGAPALPHTAETDLIVPGPWPALADRSTAQRGPRSSDAQASDGLPLARQDRWSAERPRRVTGVGSVGAPLPTEDASTTPTATDADAHGVTPDRPIVGLDTEKPSTGVGYCVFAVTLLSVAAISARLGLNMSPVLIPAAALMFAVSASRRIRRRHPDEQWVGRWLVYGVLAKLTASYLRYLTLVVGYEGVGDATGYDRWGRDLARAWLGNATAPELSDLRRTNFVRWFTGAVYYVFGSNMLAGFFIFGLFALVGSYLWYRATAESVPFLDKRLYLALVLFAPSIVFWPSSIGKESLMQLGIGSMALGTAFLLRQRLVAGLLVGAAGGWLLWVVRPHLLALVTVSGGMAYVVGRVRARESGPASLLGRPVGLIVVALLMAFTVMQGASFLGIEDLSLSSVETALDEQTERSAQGDSEFDSGGNSLSPANLPQGALTVLLRPLPWETESPFQLLASLESALLAVFIIIRFPSLRTALARARGTPYLLYCWTLTILYAATFASFANFGLLVRQRSLVLPAFFVLLAVDPGLDRIIRRRERDKTAGSERKPLDRARPK